MVRLTGIGPDCTRNVRLISAPQNPSHYFAITIGCCFICLYTLIIIILGYLEPKIGSTLGLMLLPAHNQLQVLRSRFAPRL